MTLHELTYPIINFVSNHPIWTALIMFWVYLFICTDAWLENSGKNKSKSSSDNDKA